MVLYLEDFQPQIVFSSFLFSIKHSNLLTAKITPEINNWGYSIQGWRYFINGWLMCSLGYRIS